MKTFENSRRALNWTGVKFFDDEPISWQQNIAQKVFSITFASIFIVIVTLHVIILIKVQFINPEEFFYILLQLIATVHASSAFITICSCGSGISTVFQSLTEFYQKCKQNFSNSNK